MQLVDSPQARKQRNRPAAVRLRCSPPPSCRNVVHTSPAMQDIQQKAARKAYWIMKPIAYNEQLNMDMEDCT